MWLRRKVRIVFNLSTFRGRTEPRLNPAEDEIGFHTARAMAEIDLARRASDGRAARAHLALANEHLDRIRGLSGAASAVAEAASPIRAA
jgi:hypothetical protein